MAVIGPASGFVGRDEITETFPGLDVDRVLVGPVFAVPVLELAPEAMQMDRVLHHRVVDQHEAHPLAALQDYRLGLRELLAVKAPQKALVRCRVISREGGRRSVPGRIARKSA